MNNIISKYKNKAKGTLLLPITFSLFPLAVCAQETVDSTINVAFRTENAKDVVQPVSQVNVKQLMEKSYSTYSLDNMQALAAGYNGQLWNMGDALVLIDGVPRDADNVLPSEIENITYLKGASAVVLYGSRAAKGAILITTKRGGIKPLQVRARADYQLVAAKSFPKYLDGASYMKYYNQALANDGLDAKYSDEDIYNTATGTNPYKYPNQAFFTSDYLKKTHGRWDVTAEFEGGGQFAQFYTNISYYRVGDFINFGEGKNNYTDRLNVRGNIDLQFSDWATGWVNANATYYNQRGDNSSFWSASSTLRPNRVAAFIPTSYIDAIDETSLATLKSSKATITNPAGVPAGEYFLGGTQDDSTNPFAAMYSAGYNKWTSRQMQFDCGVKLDLYKILQGLSFKTQFAVDYKTSYSTSINDNYATLGVTWTQFDGQDMVGSLTKYGKYEHTGTLNASNSAETQTIAWNGQFDYEKVWGGVHNFHATLLANGYQQTICGEYHKVSNANLGLQASYNYAHKYYVDLAANAVHSAKLAAGHREAISPSATLGWRISQEDFLKDSKWLNELRLTAGYTVLNEDLDIDDYYMYANIFTATGTWWGWSDSNNSIQTSDSQRGGNDELTFVKRKEFNVGFNGAMLDNKLSFSLNYYNTTFDGTLAQPDYVYPSYFHTYYPVSTFVPYINYGKYRRTGIDFTLGYKEKFGDFEIGAQIVGQTQSSKNLQVAENVEYDYLKTEGKSYTALWGLECEGYYNSQEEIDNASAKSSFGTCKPGDLKYKDQNGDGTIDDKDKVVIGNWTPSFTGGFNLTLKYKRFTLFTMLTAQFGGNAIKSDTYNWVYGDRKYSDVVLGAWTADKYASGEAITYPRLTTQSGDNNFRTSDYWMYSTDQINLQRVQLTYDFDCNKLFGSKALVKGLQVYVNGNSLLMIAKNREQMERNVGSSPQTRSFTVGAKVEF